MAYDFMGKIKGAKNEKMLDMEHLKESIIEIGKHHKKPIEVKVILSEKEPRRDLLVKSRISVSSLPNAHMDDLNYAVNTFKAYLEEIARLVNGEVSKTEGFYNNESTFYSLY